MIRPIHFVIKITFIVCAIFSCKSQEENNLYSKLNSIENNLGINNKDLTIFQRLQEINRTLKKSDYNLITLRKNFHPDGGIDFAYVLDRDFVSEESFFLIKYKDEIIKPNYEQKTGIHKINFNPKILGKNEFEIHLFDNGEYIKKGVYEFYVTP